MVHIQRSALCSAHRVHPRRCHDFARLRRRALPHHAEIHPRDPLAERCRKAVFKAQIPRAASGVGTIIPGAHDDPARFVREVDRRLYSAKHLGRSRMVDSGT